MDLAYSETPPFEPGWYWQRKKDDVRVMYYPHCGSYYPDHWQAQRDKQFSNADDETRQKLAMLPESTWKVEYAGPIPEPETLWKVVSKGELPKLAQKENAFDKDVSVPVLALDKFGNMRIAVVERWESDEPFKWYSNCSEHWDIDGQIVKWQYLPEIPRD